MALSGTTAQHRAKTRLMAAELRHDLKMLARNIADGDCRRAMTRFLLLSTANGEYLAERSWVSQKHEGVSKQLDKLKAKFNERCIVTHR